MRVYNIVDIYIITFNILIFNLKHSFFGKRQYLTSLNLKIQKRVFFFKLDRKAR